MRTSYIVFVAASCAAFLEISAPAICGQSLQIGSDHVFQWPRKIRKVEKGGEPANWIGVRAEAQQGRMAAFKTINGDAIFGNETGQIFRLDSTNRRLDVLGTLNFRITGLCACPKSGGLLVATCDGKITRLTMDGKILEIVDSGQNISAMECVGNHVVIGAVNGELTALNSNLKPLGQSHRVGLGCIQRIESTPDGSLICVGSTNGFTGQLSVHSGRTLASFWKLTAQRCPPVGSDVVYVEKVAFSSDKSQVAWLGSNGVVRCWDVPSQDERMLMARCENTSDFRFCDDGDLSIVHFEGAVQRVAFQPKPAKTSHWMVKPERLSERWSAILVEGTVDKTADPYDGFLSAVARQELDLFREKKFVLEKAFNDLDSSHFQVREAATQTFTKASGYFCVRAYLSTSDHSLERRRRLEGLVKSELYLENLQNRHRYFRRILYWAQRRGDVEAQKLLQELVVLVGLAGQH